MSANQLMWLYIIMSITATGVKLVLRVYCRSSGNKIVRAYAKVGFTVEVPETRLSVPMLRLSLIPNSHNFHLIKLLS